MHKTDAQLESLIQELRKAASKENAGIWRAVALDLERPTRQRSIVNLSRISHAANDNETIIVPGKVLASGELSRKVTVAAFRFSREAEKKISKSGKAITIMQLLKENPQGKNIRIMG